MTSSLTCKILLAGAGVLVIAAGVTAWLLLRDRSTPPSAGNSFRECATRWA